MSRGHAASKQKPTASRPGPSRSAAATKHKKTEKTEEKGMASKAAVATKAKVKEEAAPPEKETPETPDSPLPLLDLSDAAVKKMIKQAKKRGYVTHDQLNAVLPSEEVSSDQIEDVYAMLNEMGINVVDNEDNADDEEGKAEEAADDDDDSDGELATFDALGDFDLAFAREQGYRAHLAQVHADGIVGLVESAGGQVEFDFLAFFHLGVEFFLQGRRRQLRRSFQDVNALCAEGRQQVVEIVGRMHIVRDEVIDLIVGEIALLFAYVDQLFDIVVLIFQSQLETPQSAARACLCGGGNAD